MGRTVKVFVSYSHEDKKYLAKSSLLGYLRGLEQDGVGFWTDQRIKAGQLWDEVIKAQIQQADIALVLVSQPFLDSKYCQDVEIKQFLAHKKYLFPVILSPCEWQRHDWLASRQFLPGGDKTIETHYKNAGDRKSLFLDIRTQLRDIVEEVRSASLTAKPRSRVAQIKQESLKKRLQSLEEDYRAASDSLTFALGAMEQNKIKRQLEALEREMAAVQAELDKLA